MLEHGGRLRQAAENYGRPLSDWLDLSTGINPNGWPVPVVPNYVWAQLPQADDPLLAVASTYYGTDSILPIAGSQAAIQALPHLRKPGRVGVITPGYAEHAQAWKNRGHQLTSVTPESIGEHLPTLDVLVLIHPNNPTGSRFSPEQLLAWHQQLAQRGGWLVIDEAFMDVTPDNSLAAYSNRPGLIVLRSLGKFFGLAGVRVGFVCAEPALLNRLDQSLGPWAVSGPGRWVATRALADRTWQHCARQHLIHQGKRLVDTLIRNGLPPDGGCALFQWVNSADARRVHEHLAHAGILTRYFDRPSSLRFGLPGNEAGWTRLELELAQLASRQTTGVRA